MRQKILEYKEAKKRLSHLRKRKILVGGCFDVLHIGHILFLKAAKKQKGSLIVALESDEFITQNKKRKPLHTQLERAKIVASLEFVDVVILLPYFYSFDEYQKLVQIIAPSVIAVTDNDPQIKNKKAQVEAVGGKVVVVTSYIKHRGSRLLIRLLQEKIP